MKSIKNILPIYLVLFFFSCTSWHLVENEYISSHITPRGLYSINDTLLFMGAKEGLYKQLENGDFHMLKSFNDNTLRGICELKGILYSGFEGVGILKSTNNGATWEKTAFSLEGKSIFGLVTFDSCLYTLSYPREIHKSNDFGKTWKNISLGLPSTGDGYNLHLCKSDTFLYCSIYKEGIYRKGINETNWIPINKNLPFDLHTRKIISIDDRILCATENGVYQLKNGENFWSTWNKGIENKMIISIHKADQSIYCSSNNGQVYVLNNYTWELINKGIDKKGVIYDIASHNDKLYVTSDNSLKKHSGVYVIKQKKVCRDFYLEF